MQPKLEVQSGDVVSAEGYSFERTVMTDSAGSASRLAEIKPLKLSYSGKILELSAQERWMKMLSLVIEVTAKECKPRNMRVGSQTIATENLDYTKLGNSPDHPQYAQAKFECK